MIEKAILVERSKAVPPSAATSSSVPLMGGTGKHSGTEKGLCGVCGEYHVTSAAGAPKCELRCWNKRNKKKGGYLGDPNDIAMRNHFCELEENDPEKYVPYKKQRVV